MNQHAIRRWVFVSLLGGMFVLGFVSGSVSQRPAQAQVPGMGGSLGSAKELGSSIVEMQQHVDGLQKNLATLKKVEAALGGGKEGGTSQATTSGSSPGAHVPWQPCTCPEAGRRRVACWPSSVSWGIAAGRACDATVARRSGGDLCAGRWGLG